MPQVKIHKSTEHGRLTPVFGTSCPPHGPERRASATSPIDSAKAGCAHWLMLMLADRVNVVEDILGDLAQLRVPNLVKEIGLGAQWRYNRAGLIKSAAIAGLCVVALMAYRRSRRS